MGLDGSLSEWNAARALSYMVLIYKSLTMLTDIHPFMYMRRLAQGHHDPQLGGAGDLTSILVTTLRLPANPLFLLS